MKAIRIQSQGGSDVMKVEEIPTPKPGKGELLVKLAAAGLNYIDTYQRSGLYKVPTPFTPGNEGAGTVDALGEGVTGFKAGDEVAYTGVLGAYAEYALIPAARAVKMPKGMDLKLGAAIMLQGMTAHYLACDTYPLKKGDWCLVHAGAGGVGLLLIQIAKMRGAKVITTVSTPDKAKLAKGAGADHCILYTKDDFEAETKKIVGDRGVNVVYDAVGKTTFDKGFNVLMRRGMMVLYGASSGPVPLFDLQILNAKGSVFITRPSLVHHITTRAELEARAGEVMKWVKSGKLKVRIGATYPLAQAKQAHDDLEGRKTTGKVLLIP
jgi:NADPH2:quinone reductase